jgi:hypothetical protein
MFGKIDQHMPGAYNVNNVTNKFLINAPNLVIGTSNLGSSYTDGQLLIGNTSTGHLGAATLTAGSHIQVTNGSGTITLATTGLAASGANNDITSLSDITTITTQVETLTIQGSNGYPIASFISNTFGGAYVNISNNSSTFGLIEAAGTAIGIALLSNSGGVLIQDTANNYSPYLGFETSGASTTYLYANNNASPLTFTLPATQGTTGQFLKMLDNSGTIGFGSGGGGSGTVTSVTFTGDGTVLSSTPSSAVTTSGTVTGSLIAQTPKTFLAGPISGSNANPTFRAIKVSDLPIIDLVSYTYFGGV